MAASQAAGASSVRESLKKYLAVFGLTIACLLVFELGCRVFLRLAASPDQAAAVERRDPRAALEAYEGATYDVDALLAEDHELRKPIYRPFVVWSRPQFAGQLINIDEDGHRATHGNSPDADALRIWLLGGSTMWGQGAPDSETIPSLLAEQLNRKYELPAEVRNLGEIGYVSTQEIVSLLRELQLGRRPDCVVFLDGVNDAPVAALWPETVGTHMNYYRIRDRFEAPGRREHHPVRTALRSSGIARFAAYAREALGVRPDRNAGAWRAASTPAEVSARGEQAAELWLRNIDLVRVLGQEYGFESVFVLQPSLLVGEKPLAPSEQELQTTEVQNEAKEAGMAVYGEMRRYLRRLMAEDRVPTGVHDETDLFAEVPEAVYIDYVHMSGRGNRVIARRMAEILLGHLSEEHPPRISDKVVRRLSAINP